MSKWHDIATAPGDGRQVWVRRVYEGRVVKEGWAVFDNLAAAAPARQPLGIDPLGRLSADDYAREAAAAAKWTAEKRWLLPDRMYAFPTPTHWLPTMNETGTNDRDSNPTKDKPFSGGGKNGPK